MGRQWERQLLLPFSFYIDAKVLLFFELAKFNLECEPHGQQVGRVRRVGRVRQVGQVGQVGQVRRVGQVGRVGQMRQVGQVGRVGELFGYSSVILRSSFAYPSLIVRLSFAHRLLFLYCSLYIVLFVFLIFTSSKFFILLSDFDCISIC